MAENLKKPFFSVVMPAYNADEFIETAIDSVLAQSFKDWELIIVDDCSTDSTVDLVRKYCVQENIHLVQSKRNCRQAASRNIGIAQAKGEWVAFLDADDIWCEQKLELQKIAIENSGADIIFTNGLRLENGVQSPFTLNFQIGKHQGEKGLINLLKENFVPLSSAVVRMEVMRKYIFDEQFTNAEDYELWLRLMGSGYCFFGLNENLFTYRVHPNSSSSLADKLAKDFLLLPNLSQQFPHYQHHFQRKAIELYIKRMKVRKQIHRSEQQEIYEAFRFNWIDKLVSNVTSKVLSARLAKHILANLIAIKSVSNKLDLSKIKLLN